jgi:hypothetical protein
MLPFPFADDALYRKVLSLMLVPSIDTANAWAFFDASAEATIPGEPIDLYSYHRTPYKGGYPTRDCISSLEEKTGYITVTQVFTHIPWNDTIADQVLASRTSTQLLPAALVRYSFEREGGSDLTLTSCSFIADEP